MHFIIKKKKRKKKTNLRFATFSNVSSSALFLKILYIHHYHAVLTIRFIYLYLFIYLSTFIYLFILIVSQDVHEEENFTSCSANFYQTDHIFMPQQL